jgi:hypothetical protein
MFYLTVAFGGALVEALVPVSHDPWLVVNYGVAAGMCVVATAGCSGVLGDRKGVELGGQEMKRAKEDEVGEERYSRRRKDKVVKGETEWAKER